jgi:hypothetical protein
VSEEAVNNGGSMPGDWAGVSERELLELQVTRTTAPDFRRSEPGDRRPETMALCSIHAVWKQRL